MKSILSLLLIVCWIFRVLGQQPVALSAPIAGIEVVLSPTNPITIVSGNDLPLVLDGTQPLSTTVYNNCQYRMEVFIQNNRSTPITLRLACIWDMLQPPSPVPFEWWSVDDKPNDETAGDDNGGIYGWIPNTVGNTITLPANSGPIPFVFYDPIVKIGIGRPLNVRIIAAEGSPSNFTYRPIPIQGTGGSAIPGGQIQASDCTFFLEECITAAPNPTIVGGNLLVTTIVENASAAAITAAIRVRLEQQQPNNIVVDEILDSKPSQSYNSKEQALFNPPTASTLTANFIPGAAQVIVEYEDPSTGMWEPVKEYLCQNPTTIQIEDECASGLIPESVAPGTNSSINFQQITTLTPTFLWKKICAANSGVTDYQVEVVDYLSRNVVASFNTGDPNIYQGVAPANAFRYNTRYEWTVTAIAPQNNQVSIPFFFETPGPQNPNCQVDDVNPSTQALLYDAVQFLCDRGIVTPRNWVQGGSQYDVNPTDDMVREHLAWIAAAGVFGDKTTVQGAYFYTTLYPIPFEDLAQAASNRDRYAKLLSYLDYDDGVVPFDGERPNFQPANIISIKYALKVLLETFNIPVNAPPAQNTGNVTLPATSNSTTDSGWRYVAVANQLGLLDHYPAGTSGNDPIKRGDAFILLYKIMTGQSSNTQPLPTIADLDQADNYIESTFYKVENYSVRPALADGNFSSYSKTSFAIPGTLMPLVFGHTYASSSLTMPDELYELGPLGRGWTHNHHGYIIEKEGSDKWGGIDEYGTGKFDTSVIVFLPGSQHPHIFRRENGQTNAATKGLTYRLRETANRQSIIITTIDRTRLVFEKLPMGQHKDNVYMIREITERNGNKLQYTYQNYATNKSHLTQVCAAYLDTLGRPVPPRCFDLTYNTTNQELLETVSYPNPSGGRRNINFTYNADLDLASYKDALPSLPCNPSMALPPEQYTYQSNITGGTSEHLLNQIRLPKGNYINNTYADKKLKSSQLVDAATGNILSKTDVAVQYNKFDASRVQTVTSSSGPNNANTTSTTQIRNAAGYITNTDYLRSDGQTDVFEVEYTNTTFPQKPTKVTAYGVVTNMDYNNTGQMTRREISSSLLNLTYTERWNYDTDSLLRSYTNRRNHEMRYDYDPNTKNIISSTDFENQTTHYAYYNNGLPRQVTTPIGRVYKSVYNDYGDLVKSIGPTGITLTSSYDPVGRLIEVEDAIGNITRMTYLDNDLPNSVTRLDATGVPHTVSYCYDPNYNNIWIEDEKGQRTNMRYHNDYDYLTEIEFAGNRRMFDYDDKGRLLTERTPNNITKTYRYNTNNELLEEDGYASYHYDASNRDNLEFIRLLSNPNREYIQYFYDDFDRVTHYEYHTNGQSYQVGYEYDPEGNVTQIEYPAYNSNPGMVVNYGYNKNNQLETVEALGMQWRAERRGDGSISKIIFPNGMEKRYGYDQTDRLEDLGYFSNSSAPTATNTLSRQQFTIDDRGFFTQEQVTTPASPTLLPDLDQRFIYDNSNRIQTATNALTNTNTSPLYDPDGNQLNGHYTGMSWSNFEQLETIQNATGTFQATYTYGVLGQRNTAQRIRNGVGTTTNYFWEVSGVGHILRERRDQAGTFTDLDYIYGFGELLARIPTGSTTNNATNAVRFYVSDMRGTVVGLTDYNQNFTHEYNITSYGEVINEEIATGEVPNYFTFVGAYGVEWEDTLLYKMGVRYYDVQQVNFLSEDPIWNTNLHGYAGGNTVMAIDPEGRNYVDLNDFNINNAGVIPSVTWDYSGGYGIDGAQAFTTDASAIIDIQAGTVYTDFEYATVKFGDVDFELTENTTINPEFTVFSADAGIGVNNLTLEASAGVDAYSTNVSTCTTVGMPYLWLNNDFSISYHVVDLFDVEVEIGGSLGSLKAGGSIGAKTSAKLGLLVGGEASIEFRSVNNLCR